MSAHTLVAVGAHMDDVYYGAGPILARATRKGHRVVLVTVVSDFSTWAPTTGRENETRRDLYALAEKWGFEQIFLDYAYHQIVPDIELKKRIAEVIEDVRADVVFAHNVDDHWPDHRTCGIATKDAAVFRHGLSGNLNALRTPLVLAYELGPNQTIHFEPDTFIDVTQDMADYMNMLAECDHCLSGRPVEEVMTREVTLLQDRPALGPKTLRVSGHGWARLAQCAVWGLSQGVPYALGLKKVWSRDAGGTTLRWFHEMWPNLR